MRVVQERSNPAWLKIAGKGAVRSARASRTGKGSANPATWRSRHKTASVDKDVPETLPKIRQAFLARRSDRFFEMIKEGLNKEEAD